MQKDRKHSLIFYSLFFVISLLQAGYTELLHDEAYYWNYSRMLDWGYFDHPPMIAVLIKAGYFLFQNELGVRLFSVVLSTLTIFIIEKIVQPKKLGIFYLTIASIAILNVGFLAIPDIPLLFFAASFFWSYKRFLKNESISNLILLGLCMGLMLLSKYHGILIIGFTVLSNLKLLRNTKFWLAGILGVGVLIPHLLWQLNHGFPSVNYHLFERSSDPYTINNTLEYLLTQPFVFGPIIGILLLYFGFTFTPTNKFEKAVKVNLVGVYIFFFIMTFKGRIEAHWTIVALIPLIYVLFNHHKFGEKTIKAIKIIFPISLVIITFVRVFLVYDFLPSETSKNLEFHHWDKWAEELKEISDDKPLVFINSYQQASKYSFYAQLPSISLNNIYGRKNQFDIWNLEKNLQGKEVVILPRGRKNFKSITTVKGEYNVVNEENFRSFSFVKINTNINEIQTELNKPFEVDFSIEFKNGFELDFEANESYPAKVYYYFFEGKHHVSHEVTDIHLTNNNWRDNTYSITITPPSKPGKYALYISIRSGWLPPSFNSDKIMVQVK